MSFFITIVGKSFTKNMTCDEAKLLHYVPSFVVHQAKTKGDYSTTVINDGESYTWHIKYKPN